MWWDADIDARMKRTAGRPIPSGRVAPGEALGIGLALSGFAIVVLALATNFLAAVLLAFTIFFYVIVYSMWLKRATPQNIVIGGAAGAFPPMIGWAVATGGVSIESVLMFALTFMWTPPHFWALALYRREEYAKVGIPMLPVTHGEKFTLLHIILYTIILAIVTLMPFSVGMSGLIYLFFATILNAIFLYYVVVLYRNYSDKLSKKVFNYSILYLSLIFAAFLVDHYYKFIFV
jgi:protoheme IX farnesyltransferase